MALIKSKQTDYGVEASYWRLSMVSIDRHMKEASFSLNLYVVKGATQFLESYSISLLGIEDKIAYNKYFESNEFIDIYQACYQYVKDNEEYFSDAISDEE